MDSDKTIKDRRGVKKRETVSHTPYQIQFLLVPLLGSLLAFFYYNSYPSKIFPGDTLTLFMGATIGCGAIINNLKLEGAILLTPMIIEFFLKLKGSFKAECFATSIENDILSYDGPIESLTHFIMKNYRVNEIKLLSIFFSIEILISILVIYFNTIGFF